MARTNLEVAREALGGMTPSERIELLDEGTQMLRKRELVKLLERLLHHERVRELLAEQLVGVKGAGKLLGVERSRIWRYAEAGQITPFAVLEATKVFLRVDLLRFLAENPPQRRRRHAEGSRARRR